MKCKKCGKEFEGKFCPNCGTPVESEQEQQPQAVQPTYQQPVAYQAPTEQPKKKKKGCLTAAIIVAVLIILIALLAHSCGSSQPEAVSSSPQAKATQASQSEKNSSKNSSSENNIKKTFKVGDIVKYNDIELSVTKVQKTKGGEYDSPKAGCEYVIATVKYKNDGKENISYNPYDFKMKNSKGQITDSTYISGIEKSQLSSGNLAPNGEVSGDIAFEEPKGDKGLVLQYTGNIFVSESEVDFQLG